MSKQPEPFNPAKSFNGGWWCIPAAKFAASVEFLNEWNKVAMKLAEVKPYVRKDGKKNETSPLSV